MMKTELVVFDIDGTLANNAHRVHYLEGVGKKDWDSFFALQGADSPYENVVDLLNMYLARLEVHVAILTGRGEEWRGVTEEWLLGNDIDYHSLTMRPLGDRTDDNILKLNQIQTWQDQGYNVIGLFDDRKRICDAAREHGVTVFQMAAGEF